MIVVPEKRIAQPQTFAPLNPWIANNTIVVNAAVGRTYNSNRYRIVSVVKLGTPFGVSFGGTASAGRIETGFFDSLTDVGATFIFQLWYRTVNLNNYSIYTASGNNYGEDVQVDRGLTSFSSGNIAIDLTGTTSSTLYTTSAPLVAGRLYTIICRIKPSGSELWVNGRQISLTVSGSFTTPALEVMTVSSAMRTTGNSRNNHLFFARQYGWIPNPEQSADPNWVWQYFFQPQRVAAPTYYPILSNLQATRGNTSAALRTNINY